MTVETGNLSPTSKTNNLNLIKMMMLMVDNNGTKKEESTIKKHQQHVRSDEEASSQRQHNQCRSWACVESCAGRGCWVRGARAGVGECV